MADRVLVYDCFSGISGDMHIGAMLDLGVPLELLNDELARLGLGDEFSLEVRRADKHGITGTQATVRLKHHDHHHHRPSIRSSSIPNSFTSQQSKKKYTPLRRVNRRIRFRPDPQRSRSTPTPRTLRHNHQWHRIYLPFTIRR